MKIHTLGGRLGDRVREFGKFSLVLTSVYFIEVPLFNLFRNVVHTEPLTAKALSYSICAMITFFINRHWTWRDHERTGLFREYLVYFLIAMMSLGLMLILLAFTHYGLGSIFPQFRTTLADNKIGRAHV